MNSIRTRPVRRDTAAGQCVAEPREGNGFGTIYRGADHVRCSHPTPIPAGTRRCEGENGCPFRLTGNARRCWYHLTYDLTGSAEAADWGGPQPLTGNWTTR